MAPAAEAAGVEVARSRHGMVVAGHPEAAEIGRRVLEAGGSAMDAAVAVSLALGAAEPYGSGLGGKLMFLYRDRASGRVFAVDAMDQSSSTLDVGRFVARSYEERSEGWGAVAVPGLLAGLDEGHRRWGRLPWEEVVRPAAELARSGARVLARTRSFFERRIERIRVSEEAGRIFLPGGELPQVGQRLANPDLARTLETIARQGRDGFYRGPVAAAIAGASRDGGGSLTSEDLAGYRARVVEPRRLDVFGVTVLTAPPPASGGATLLAALARLAEADWSGGSLLDPDSLDRIGRVLQRTYPEIQARIADVPSARDAFRELLETAPSATPSRPSGSMPPESESTTHLVVFDAAGNAASVTQSLSHHFGAGVVAPGTGIVLNNTMKNFATLDQGSVNFAAPAKRPRSTIAPTLVLRRGEPVLALGVPGGQRIPTATLQVLLDYLLFRTDLAAAIRRPRAHLRRPLREGGPTNVFELEAADDRLAAALRERGWAIETSDDNETFGGFCAVEILPDHTRVGVADLRRTNAARAAGEAMPEARIAAVLDDFHAAAAAADEERYFGHLAPTAVFLGTDASERWTKEAFRAFAHPYFARGQGWTYRATSRNITLAADGRTAWFDEALESASYGECRGSGVLQLRDGGWKIEQYNLTIPIPNQLAEEFVARIRALGSGEP